MELPSPELLATLGTHRRHRPLRPEEAAKQLKEFLEKGGRLEQLPITKEQAREFLSLLKLPSSIQKMLGWRGVIRGEIGVDSAYRISMLKDDHEKEILAKAILENNLTSKEVRKIVIHRNRHKDKSIEQCIKDVIAIRPIKRHLFITQLNIEAIKLLREKAEAHKVSILDILREIICKQIPEKSLISVNLKDNFVILLLEKEGYETLLKIVKESSVPLSEVINLFVLKDFG